jgi:hypothetical protein
MPVQAEIGRELVRKREVLFYALCLKDVYKLFFASFTYTCKYSIVERKSGVKESSSHGKRAATCDE